MNLEEEFLSCTNALIERRLTRKLDAHKHGDAHNLLLDTCSHLCTSHNAKRARPLLCLYYWLFGHDTFVNDLVDIGVAAEFIHAASLLHDDVIDEAEKRRGKKTANHLFGNSIAVLGGNFLLTEAFELLARFDQRIIHKSIAVIAQMTRAAIMEIDMRRRTDIDEATYRSMAVGKTGVLFGWCGYATGILQGNKELAEELLGLGNHIGAIFQMADDLKDFDGDKNLKDQCRDIRNREPSLPIILAMKDPDVKHEFSQAFNQEEIGEDLVVLLRSLVVSSGAIEQTQALMADELGLLQQKLKHFDGRLGKELLRAWVNDLVSTT